MKTAAERFWSKVKKTHSCWIWIGSKDAKGYGHFRNGRVVKSYRWSYEFNKGPIPKGLCVCHRCDNPSCVNPDHLFVGTNLDNARDRNQKKRDTRGENHVSAKLTEKQVLEIRSRLGYWGITRALAKEFNVNHSSISNIRARKAWNHI